MQFRKSPIAVAALALFGSLPLAAQAQSTSAPYSGSAVSLPASIAAVNFDKGGEGVAYHDLSSANLGGLYRTSEAVDIYASTDTASGPYQVANFQTGEWMKYTINVPANGSYDLGIRASNNSNTGAFHIEVDGVNVTGTVSVPKTGSWSTYQWFGKKGVPLSAGTHVVRLVAEQQWFNVSALSMVGGATTSTGGTTTSGGTTSGGTTSGGTTSGGTTSGGTSSAPTSTPYTGTAVSLPASIAAVNFDKGGQGLAYNDLSSTNLGGLYRTSEAVDIYASGDTASGPYQVANFQSGEWLKYTVNLPANGNYDLGIRAANNGSTGAFHIEVDGVNVTGTVSVPKTGSWTTYQWFGKKAVALTAGTHVVRLVADQQWFNVSALSIPASATTSTGGTTSGGTTSGGTTSGGTTSGGTSGGTTTASTPYTGTAVSLPVSLAAVNFDKGGEGIAYHDLSSGNLGGLYRTAEAVDIYTSGDTASGPYQVANFQTGEWLKYTVKVPANGNYDLGIRAANNGGTGAFHIEVDGTNVTGTVSVPSTGSWTNYQWFGKKGVPLTAGTHVVRLVADQQWFNLSALSMPASSTTSGGTTSGGTTSGGTTSGSTTTKPANLLFWSGFEGAVALAKPTDCYGNGCFQDIGGSDSATGYSWPVKLMNGDSRFQLISNSTTYPSPDTIGDWMYNEVQSAVGPKGNTTRVLYSEVKQSGCCGTDGQGGGSTQDALHLLPGGEMPDVYISKWMKFQPNLAENLKAGGPWRVVFEFKEGGGSVGGGGAFRGILSVVYRTEMSAPQWQVTWDNDANGGLPLQRFWRAENASLPVPIGEWFKLEVFWHRAKDNTGRVWFAVNGKVIDDHYGPTIGVNNTPVGRIFVNQVYTGAPYPIYQWTDDIQVWKGWPTAKQGEAWYDPPYAAH